MLAGYERQLDQLQSQYEAATGRMAQAEIDSRLAEMQLVRLSRLSVCGVTPAEWQVICEMARG